MHRLGWAVLLALLLALFVGALTFDKRSWPAFAGDEATYLMLAESLAWDADIHYGRTDYERFLAHWQRPPDGLILQSSDGGRTLTYGKPALYSLAVAPFVRLAPRRGIVIANVVFLGLAACWAAGALRAAAESAAPWLVACFVFASVAFAHVFWAHPDLFLMDLVAIALALVYGGEEPHGPQFDDRGERRFTWRWLAAGILLGAVLACRPFYGALLLPAAAAVPAGRRRRGWAALAGGSLAAVLLTVGTDFAARGSFTSYGAERLSFESATGFPGVTAQAASWSERIAARGGPGSWVAPDRLLPYRFDGRLWAYDTLYLAAGRHLGLFPYYAPALLGLLLFRPQRGRVFLLLAVGLVAAGFFAVRPFNFYGGGGALANRYLLPAYPALWFLAARPARLRSTVAAALVAAPFLWPLWLAPRAFPWTPEGGYRYVSNVARRLLPYETTQSHLKPGGAEDFVHHGLWIKPLGTETRAIGGGAAIGCFRGTAPFCGELLVGSERPLSALRLRQTSGAPLRVRATGGVVAASADPAGGSRLALGEPYARHRMWWLAPDVYIYRLVLEAPQAATFELEAEGAS
jgi:hypothetical protein